MAIVLTVLWLGGMHLTDLCAEVLDGEHYRLPLHFERYTFFCITFLSIASYLAYCSQSKHFIMHVALSIPFPFVACGIYLFILSVAQHFFSGDLQIAILASLFPSFTLSIFLIPDAWYVLLPLQAITVISSIAIRDRNIETRAIA